MIALCVDPNVDVSLLAGLPVANYFSHGNRLSKSKR
jgi:hypothetical protein